jgi:hypothetical protein
MSRPRNSEGRCVRFSLRAGLGGAKVRRRDLPTLNSAGTPHPPQHQQCNNISSAYGDYLLKRLTTCIAVAATMTIDDVDLAQLRILQRQYFQLVDPSQLRWPDAQVLKSPDVQSWIFLHMFDESSVKSPPPERFQLRVLKLLISKLERSIVDPEEDVRFPVSSRRFCRDTLQSVVLYTVLHIVQIRPVNSILDARSSTSYSAADRSLFPQSGNIR